MQSNRKSFRTLEDLEVHQVAGEFPKPMYAVNRRLHRRAGATPIMHESSPAFGMTGDELDALLNDSTVQRFNDSTIRPS
jgi:hypothetical protein